MAKGRPVLKTEETHLGPAAASAPQTPPGMIQVNPGNVPIVTVQILNDINVKLGKILARMERNG